jgi:hypothetical protein
MAWVEGYGGGLLGLMNTGINIHVCTGIDHGHKAWMYEVGLTQDIKSYA